MTQVGAEGGGVVPQGCQHCYGQELTRDGERLNADRDSVKNISNENFKIAIIPLKFLQS
jgi:hypothetical protein